ncbi:MAG: hypothetical protein LIO93_02665 [Bacteroidales bacterium]|nr:hypothetical protein [Bacteroidales bacterium]
MKKMSKVTLESMRNELSVLERNKLEKIRGGYFNNDWGCLFDCLELVNELQGCNNRDAQSYYTEYVDNLSYRGGAMDPRNRRGVDVGFKRGYSDSENLQIKNYPPIAEGGLNDMLNSLNPNNKNESVIMAIDTDRRGIGHFVVGTDVSYIRDENGNLKDISIVYQDPSNKKSGTISISDVKGFWSVKMNCNDDTGNLDDTGNMY